MTDASRAVQADISVASKADKAVEPISAEEEEAALEN